jgi:hypothetical protein
MSTGWFVIKRSPEASSRTALARSPAIKRKAGKPLDQRFFFMFFAETILVMSIRCFEMTALPTTFPGEPGQALWSPLRPDVHCVWVNRFTHHGPHNQVTFSKWHDLILQSNPAPDCRNHSDEQAHAIFRMLLSQCLPQIVWIVTGFFWIRHGPCPPGELACGRTGKESHLRQPGSTGALDGDQAASAPGAVLQGCPPFNLGVSRG